MVTAQWESLTDWLTQNINQQYYIDIIIGIAFLLWLLIFTISLKGIDCSHTITALTYITWCSATGVFIVIGIPTKYFKNSDLRVDFLLVFTFALIAALNWFKEIWGRQNRKANKKK